MTVTDNPISSEPIDLTGRRVAVIGLARSGMASARFLLGRGARVVGADAKTGEELADERHQLLELGGEFVERFATRAQLGAIDLVVVSPGVPEEHPALQMVRAEGIPIIGELELAYRFCAAPVIAVTGTNGKGSTCVMIGSILAAAGIDHLVAGNIGLPLISQVDRTEEVQFVVLEVSSFQMESIDRFRPYVAALLNISPDHLDRHPDFSTYLRAKYRMFSNQRPTDFAVISLDDPCLQPLIGDLTAQLLTFSLHNPEANARVEEDRLVLEIEPGSPEAVGAVEDLPVGGDHFVRNALAAALAARLVGADSTAIAAGLAAFHPADHLLQVVATIRGVRFVDDSKATNVAAALADLACLGRPLVPLVGGVSKNVDFHEFGERLGRECLAVCLVGESSEVLAKAIGDRTRVVKCGSLEEAVETAFSLAPEGATVALLPGCASFDMFRDQVDRGQAFTRCVRELSYRYAVPEEASADDAGSGA